MTWRPRPRHTAWRPRSVLPLLSASLAIVAGCQSDGWNGTVPSPDPDMFRTAVYPVLMRDCAFNECHGAEHRFFQVFGPSRLRADPKTQPNAAVEPIELQLSYDRARSMLVTTEPITRSQLLAKPLEQSAGGVGHRGEDDFNRNVYQSPQDDGYQVLLKWAQTSAGSAKP
jgi:hypothetical protein